MEEGEEDGKAADIKMDLKETINLPDHFNIHFIISKNKKWYRGNNRILKAKPAVFQA